MIEEVTTEKISNINKKIDEIKSEILKRVKINKSSINLVLTSFFSGLHLLLEDLPGMGKTTLAKTLVNLIDNENDDTYSFKRLQFTADLLPYDIIGTEIFSKEKEQFIFIKGPIFSGILLADEINRGNPKVQSALLEGMGENQVTAFGKTYKLHPLFYVIATQNPKDIEGTFPLPISSLDRFGLCFSLGYPDYEQQREILQKNLIDFVAEDVKKIIKLSEIKKIREFIKNIYVDEKLIEIINKIGFKSRNDPNFTQGFSVRALLHLLNAMKAYALVARGETFCIDEDLKSVILPVISHRIYSEREKDYLPKFIDDCFKSELY